MVIIDSVLAIISYKKRHCCYKQSNMKLSHLSNNSNLDQSKILIFELRLGIRAETCSWLPGDGSRVAWVGRAVLQREPAWVAECQGYRRLLAQQGWVGASDGLSVLRWSQVAAVCAEPNYSMEEQVRQRTAPGSGFYCWPGKMQAHRCSRYLGHWWT